VSCLESLWPFAWYLTRQISRFAGGGIELDRRNGAAGLLEVEHNRWFGRGGRRVCAASRSYAGGPMECARDGGSAAIGQNWGETQRKRGTREETPPTSRISLRDKRQIVAGLRVVALCFKSHCMYIHHIAPEQKFTPPPGLPANAVPASSLSQEQQSIECVNKSVYVRVFVWVCACVCWCVRMFLCMFLLINILCTNSISLQPCDSSRTTGVYVCVHALAHTHDSRNLVYIFTYFCLL